VQISRRRRRKSHARHGRLVGGCVEVWRHGSVQCATRARIDWYQPKSNFSGRPAETRVARSSARRVQIAAISATFVEVTFVPLTPRKSVDYSRMTLN
jgi:hypothetical protein